ncbi:MAG: glutathione peroxidase [Tenericutes bacterium]|nr:glutathione peroxidase [Mycoplasmatota bacterium]
MSIYEYKVKTAEHQEVSLSQYKGKVLLIVNTATKCGFTPQYEGLEKLYEKYHDKGFEILDFPSNQFMNQAPGTDQELKEFCQLNYGTQFQTFAKIEVNGKNAHPLYKFLRGEIKKDMVEEGTTSFLSKVSKSDKIKWNFTKFLIDKKGNVVQRFSPSFRPVDLENYIEELL